MKAICPWHRTSRKQTVLNTESAGKQSFPAQRRQSNILSRLQILPVPAQMHKIDRLLRDTVTCTLFKVQAVPLHTYWWPCSLGQKGQADSLHVVCISGHRYSCYTSCHAAQMRKCPSPQIFQVYRPIDGTDIADENIQHVNRCPCGAIAADKESVSWHRSCNR